MKIKNIILAAIAILMVAFVPTPARVGASSITIDDSKDACDVMDATDPNYNLICGSGSNTDAQAKVKGVLNVVFTLIGIVAVIVMIIGAVYYMISQGEPKKIEKAKNTIMYALIGLIVTLSAFAITNFIISAVSS